MICCSFALLIEVLATSAKAYSIWLGRLPEVSVLNRMPLVSVADKKCTSLVCSGSRYKILSRGSFPRNEVLTTPSDVP